MACNSLFVKKICMIWWHKLVGCVSGWSWRKWVWGVCPGLCNEYISSPSPQSMRDWLLLPLLCLQFNLFSESESRTDLVEENNRFFLCYSSVRCHSMHFMATQQRWCSQWQEGESRLNSSATATKSLHLLPKFWSNMQHKTMMAIYTVCCFLVLIILIIPF